MSYLPIPLDQKQYEVDLFGRIWMEQQLKEFRHWLLLNNWLLNTARNWH